jgi:REP element-mobilizing transposase RayT
MNERYCVENGFYHTYNRGNRKQDVFKEKEDYQKFLEYLEIYSKKWDIGLITYALIPNHYHLVLKDLSGVSLSKFMHNLGTSYSMYMNRKYNLVGHLFQGRFKSVFISSYDLLFKEIEYVVNNPLKHGLVKDPKDYPWVKVQPNPLW